MSTRAARWATALAVLAVATIAAIVSYAHVESLALGHGYTLATARLLPFSVDGLILAASMALATGARTALARAGLVLGILATVLANVAYGAHYGIVGGVVSAWPAVAFLFSSEILVGMLRRPATAPQDVTASTVEAVTSTPLAGDTASAVAACPATGTSQDVPEAVPAEGVPPVLAAVPKAVAAGRAPRRAPVGNAKSPEHVFREELAAGQLPSLRAIKERAHCGTDRARVILAELAAMIETPQAA